MTALDLDHLSQGRFTLGLGTGPEHFTKGYYMARMFVACGTPDQVRERIEPLWQRANSMMIAPPSWGLTPERYAVKAAAIAETFWTA